MISELKSATARANGAKSRGPKTEATRAISARNSLGHGLTARNTVLLECENPDEFNAMLAEFEEIYRPANPEQKNLVDEMVAARWKLDRYGLIEAALIDDELETRRKLPGNHPDIGISLSRAIRSLADGSAALNLIRRYQANLHRVYDKAYRILRELQAKAEASSRRLRPLVAPVQPIRPVQNEPTAAPIYSLEAPEKGPEDDDPVLIHSLKQSSVVIKKEQS